MKRPRSDDWMGREREHLLAVLEVENERLHKQLSDLVGAADAWMEAWEALNDE